MECRIAGLILPWPEMFHVKRRRRKMDQSLKLSLAGSVTYPDRTGEQARADDPQPVDEPVHTLGHPGSDRWTGGDKKDER